MPFRLHIFLLLAILFVFQKMAQAQLTITSVTPNVTCIGTPITVTFNSIQTGTLSVYLHSPNSTNYGSPQQTQSITAGNNLSVTIQNAFSQTPGSYTIRLINNVPSSTTYTSISGVTINAIPSAPASSFISYYCQGMVASQLIATPGPGGILNWYGTNSAGGATSLIAPVPSTSQPGTTNYYVSQTINDCEGPRAAISVQVRAIPNAPAVNSLTYCQGSTANTLTATANSGATLNWYGTWLSGGTASFIPPIPSTSQPGITNYYVSQTITGCEGPRATISVTVKPKPTVYIDAGDAILTPTQASLTLTATASTSTLSWSTGENTRTIIISTAGVYSVTATDVYGCLASANASISQSPLDVVYSVKAGAWDDPTVWSINQVPTAIYAVRLRHVVSLPTTSQAQAGILGYDAGGQLQTGPGSGIRVGSYD